MRTTLPIIATMVALFVIGVVMFTAHENSQKQEKYQRDLQCSLSGAVCRG